MGNPTITGTGPNSRTNLQNIHSGARSFQKDLATTHSQVALMQKALTDLGYDTQGADSKFGNNTLSAVHIVGGYAAVQRWDGTKWTTYKSFYFDKYDTDSSSF